MNFLNFSRYLYKRLSSFLLLWVFLLLTFIVMTFTLTGNLEANGIALSRFGTLATQINHLMFTHQHTTTTPRSAHNQPLLDELEASYRDLLSSLNQCCSRESKKNQRYAISQFEASFGELRSLLVNTELAPHQKNQQLQRQAQSINSTIQYFVTLIEQKNTRTITFLRLYRLGLLLILISSALMAYILVKRRLLNPLMRFAHQMISQKQRQKHQAVVQERNLLAQYLHDSVTQSLTFLNMQIHELSKHPNLKSDPTIQRRLQVIYKGIEYCHDDIRNLLANYHHSLVDHNTLNMIEIVVQRIQDSTAIPISLYVISDDLVLNDDHKIQVAFILQEALINSSKHSGATQIDVILDDDRDFIMRIEDNGQGIATHIAERQAAFDGKHIGMQIMKERANKIGAILTISSQDNQGTIIELIIPANKRCEEV